VNRFQGNDSTMGSTPSGDSIAAMPADTLPKAIIAGRIPVDSVIEG